MRDFWANVNKTETCWLWKGALERTGYTRYSVNGKRRMVHRYAYELTKGEIPEGLVIDHTCRVRHCVNPEHLEAVTTKENNYRIPGYQGLKDTCKLGHPMDGKNKNQRFCRTCSRGHWRAYSKKRRAKARESKVTRLTQKQ